MGNLCIKSEVSEITVKHKDAPAIVAEETSLQTSKSQSTDQQVRTGPYKRLYHNTEGSPYSIPTDIAEGHRLNLQHELFKFINGSNYFLDEIKPELEKGIKVLDVGTGSGIWAAETANDFPNSSITTVDIALGDWAKVAEKIPNVTCTFGNILDKLPFEDNTFDYVHQRLLVIGIPDVKWPSVIKELKRVTKPGGWIELVESDAVFRDSGPKLSVFAKGLLGAFAKLGISCTTVINIGKMLEDEGLSKVSHSYFSSPIGWDGALGEGQAKNMRELLFGAKVVVAPFLKMESDEYDQALDEAVAEAKDYKGYINGYWAVGQKSD